MLTILSLSLALAAPPTAEAPMAELSDPAGITLAPSTNGTEVTIDVATDGTIRVVSRPAEPKSTILLEAVEEPKEPEWVQAAPWLRTRGVVSPWAVRDSLTSRLPRINKCAADAKVDGLNLLVEVGEDGQATIEDLGSSDPARVCAAKIITEAKMPTNSTGSYVFDLFVSPPPP